MLKWKFCGMRGSCIYKWLLGDREVFRGFNFEKRVPGLKSYNILNFAVFSWVSNDSMETTFWKPSQFSIERLFFYFFFLHQPCMSLFSIFNIFSSVLSQVRVLIAVLFLLIESTNSDLLCITSSTVYPPCLLSWC